MKTRPRSAGWFLTFIALSYVLSAQVAKAQQLVTGLSMETISITSDFTGTELIVFGTINNMQAPAGSSGDHISMDRYDIVVVVEGPREPRVIRRKERTGGIWINRESVHYDEVPSSYLMMMSRPVGESRFDRALRNLKVGFQSTSFGALKNATTDHRPAEFRSALIRLKVQDGLYTQTDGVRFIADNLFRARFQIPALVPVGTHKVSSYLLFDDQVVSQTTHEISIIKTGFEQWMFDFAHDHGVIYGIFAVLLAMLTGWLSSVIFRRD